MDAEQNIRALRQALEASPDNVPLRRHVADLLSGLGRHAEAEQDLRHALRHAPHDVDLKLALARCYRAGGKLSAAAVLLDDMIEKDEGAGATRIERSKTRFASGDVEGAVRDYKFAIDEDPELADEDLAEKLGVQDAEFESLEEPSEIVDGRLRHVVDGASSGPQLQPIKPDENFGSVGGMDELKAEIRRRIVLPLTNPELFEAYGRKVGGGILLYGPPGCGKTHLARATAGEIDATFLSVGIHEVLEMWIGQSERNLHQIFETARQSAPCVLFFDEVDALGASRGDLKHHAGRQTINQFLAEMDGLGSANDGVLVLAATNAPWHMDPAFRRPGRFDRVLFVPPPDEPARESILRVLLEGKPQNELDLAAVARKTDRFSGADLRAVVERSVDAILEEALKSGTPEPLTTKALLRGAKQHRPTTREWLQSARNYVLYANDGGLYDELKSYLKL